MWHLEEIKRRNRPGAAPSDLTGRYQARPKPKAPKPKPKRRRRTK